MTSAIAYFENCSTLNVVVPASVVDLAVENVSSSLKMSYADKSSVILSERIAPSIRLKKDSIPAPKKTKGHISPKRHISQLSTRPSTTSDTIILQAQDQFFMEFLELENKVSDISIKPPKRFRRTTDIYFNAELKESKRFTKKLEKLISEDATDDFAR